MNTLARKSSERSRLDWALHLARLGLKIFPLKPGTKEPLLSDSWKALAATDETQIRKWFNANPHINFGVNPGENFVAVDLDCKELADGLEAFGLLELEHGAVETFRVRTPSGGMHIYLSVNYPVFNSHSFPEGIDVRGAGGYVVGPGCELVEGKCKPKDTPGLYEVYDENPIARAPEWILDCLKPHAKKKIQNLIGELDEPHAIGRARAFLRRREPAIEGQNGQDHTYKTACYLKDFGLSESLAGNLMSSEWNERCEPPWDGAELSQIVSNAYRYAQNPPGSKYQSGEHMFGDLENVVDIANYQPSSLNESSECGPISFSEVLSRKPAPVCELVPGLVEKGVTTFLAGAGGSNKSRLALQIGLCVDAGKSVFGRQTDKSTFVYLSSEDGPDEVCRRTHAIARRLDLPKDSSGLYWDCTGGDTALALMREGGEVEAQPFYTQLRDKLCAMPGHKFVVIDSCYDFASFAGRAKIDEGAVNAFVKRVLDGLCKETDSTLIVVWHPSQAGMERGDATGWSVAWNNAPRARLSMQRVKDSVDAYSLKVEKRNHGPTGAEITLHWSDGALVQLSQLHDAEQKNRLAEASIAFAIECAERGHPIQGQRRLFTWQFDRIEEAAGARPTDRQVKEILSAAQHDGALTYMSGDKYHSAGYYPADRAKELAAEAKRKRSERSAGA